MKNTGTLLYPDQPEEQKWVMWAIFCQQVLQYYLPHIKLTIRPTTDECPAWNFQTSIKYEKALLSVFCSIMKYIHLIRYSKMK